MMVTVDGQPVGTGPKVIMQVGSGWATPSGYPGLPPQPFCQQIGAGLVFISVHLVASTAISGGSTICTLPAGFVPAYTQIVVGMADISSAGGPSPGSYWVTSGGAVELSSYSASFSAGYTLGISAVYALT